MINRDLYDSLVLQVCTASVVLLRNLGRTLLQVSHLATTDKYLSRPDILSTSVESFTNNYGNTGCGVFKRWVQNQKDFGLRINMLKEFY